MALHRNPTIRGFQRLFVRCPLYFQQFIIIAIKTHDKPLVSRPSLRFGGDGRKLLSSIFLVVFDFRKLGIDDIVIGRRFLGTRGSRSA